MNPSRGYACSVLVAALFVVVSTTHTTPAAGDPAPRPTAARLPAPLSDPAAAVTPRVAQGIEGAWQARRYVLSSGQEHVVDGFIFFTPSDWTVLFFVLDGDGEPRRGSGEGGTYVLDGDRLTFNHRYNLSGGEALEGLPASPWGMQIHDAADEGVEPCTVTIGPDRLTIHFPSGNRMMFTRSS